MTARLGVLVVVLLLTGFAGGLALSGRTSLLDRAEPSVPADAVAPAAVSAEPGAPLEAQAQRGTAARSLAALPDLSAVAERALLASVNISSTQYVRVRDPYFEFFFGANPVRPQQSLGSGVIVSPDGYILTNTHVVGDARAEIQVTLPDRREVPATIVGTDDITDLAVVKVSENNLQPLPWGDSDRLRIAEWVLAVGNPFQLSGTVTLGIVSTVNRPGEQVGAYSDFIQTDAAINQGNSGGALVNSRGELVGINTMIYSETGGNIGIGFAIPANIARRIMDDLRQHGQVTWGSLGRVHWQTVTRSQARRYGLGDVDGVLAVRLWDDSSAYRAGLRPGDIVVAMNGEAVTDADQLSRSIIASEVGARARLEIVRDGRRLTLDVPVVNR
jgi:Do/DeqQ family serine protease